MDQTPQLSTGAGPSLPNSKEGSASRSQNALLLSETVDSLQAPWLPTK